MGLRADIYKAGGRTFSLGGLSEVADEVTLVNVPGPFEPDEKAPAALLVDGARGTARVVPAEQNEAGEWAEVRKGVGSMMGGSYVGAADSRFREAVEEILGHRFYGAVALHDRFETVEQYAEFST